jgi:hypothetical protein
MIITITPTRQICDIQNEFNAVFPFLKIEFFFGKPTINNGYGAAQLISNKKSIGDAQTLITNGIIEIDATTKVNELEKKFKEEFSLAAQIFRKSGNLWIETTMTDNWTLEQQNKHGEEISLATNKIEVADDYDLTRDME